MSPKVVHPGQPVCLSSKAVQPGQPVRGGLGESCAVDSGALQKSVITAAQRIDGLERQIDNLHSFLEDRGYNSRNTKDVMGRTFQYPVDEEHKSKKIHLLSFAKPHMRAFHLSWVAFLATFFSTFAAAPLLPYIKRSLSLTKPQLANAAMASVGSTVLFRVLMGYICDTVGARKGMAILLLLTTPPLVWMRYVEGPIGFTVCRALIGIGLASFVACQAWVSVMFSKNIVGLANATAAGWGNLGGGFTNLLMPFIFLAILHHNGDGDEDRAWRDCFLFPAALHLVIGMASLLGRDLPDGNFDELEASGAKQKADGGVIFKVGLSNINAWILTIVYGMSFGVELTVTNEAALYFHDYHGLSVAFSGVLASSFGMMNLFARSLGGWTSDALNHAFGIRGRIWCLCGSIFFEGVFSALLGLVTVRMEVAEVPDSETAMRSVVLLSLFSLFVQMAEGTTYSIVPSVNRAALGVIAGLVGAGGNLGSVINTKAFFASDDIRTDTAFIYMGIAIMATSPIALLLYFPEEGGGLVRRGGWGSYDPQLVKPPSGYRGADSMDYAAAATLAAASNGGKPRELI